MLLNIFSFRLRVKNLMLWQHDVLHFWHKDDTATAMDRYHDVDGDSGYYLRVGTPPRSRRASEGSGPVKLVRDHRRARSNGAVTSLGL